MKTFFFLFAIISLSLASQVFAQSKATQDLMTAVKKEKLKLVKEALHDKGDPNGFNHDESPTNTVFLEAVKRRNIEIVKFLLENGANIDQKMPLNLISSGYTGLMLAVRNHDAAMVKFLISKNADVNSESLLGRTALHIGALNNSVEEIKLLLGVRGIDVNARPSMCALFVAARQNHVGVVRLLLGSSNKSSDPCLDKAINVAELNHSEESLALLHKELAKREEQKASR